MRPVCTVSFSGYRGVTMLPAYFLGHSFSSDNCGPVSCAIQPRLSILLPSADSSAIVEASLLYTRKRLQRLTAKAEDGSLLIER